MPSRRSISPRVHRSPRPRVDESAELERIVARSVAESERSRLTSQLEKYLGEIRAWNARGNLVAAGDLGRLVSRHVAESLAILPVIDELRPHSVIDIGAGGGFPGIPLKLARPEIALAMVESRRMKALFLRRVGIALALASTWVWSMRVETLSALLGPAVSVEEAGAATGGDDIPRFRPEADMLTARAVASLSSLAEWSAPLVRPGGHLVAFKGSRLEGELAEWRQAPGPWEEAGVQPISPEIQAVLLRRADVSRETFGSR